MTIDIKEGFIIIEFLPIHMIKRAFNQFAIFKFDYKLNFKDAFIWALNELFHYYKDEFNKWSYKDYETQY